MYHPLTPGAMGGADAQAVRVAFHVRGDASALAPRVREIARVIDPALRAIGRALRIEPTAALRHLG